MNMIPEDTMPPDLAARLARLREATATIQPPAYVEAQLNARLFGASNGATVAPSSATKPALRRPPTFAERWAAWIAWPVSVTAAAGLVSWMVYTNPAIAPEQIGPSSVPALESRESNGAAMPFLALTSLDEIKPGARNEVVSATVPRATLAEFGLPVSPLRAAEPIDAEFLVGANGGVLAVRFVDTAPTLP
jgi:hypothetical protein